MNSSMLHSSKAYPSSSEYGTICSISHYDRKRTRRNLISVFNRQELSGIVNMGDQSTPLQTSLSYQVLKITAALLSYLQEGWQAQKTNPWCQKIPDHVRFQSTLPQDKALALFLQISRQNLLSPCSHSHTLLYLTYLAGREGCQAFWWEKPETHTVLQRPVRL